MSAVSSIFAYGFGGLRPEKEAKLEEMEKDYEEFIRQKRDGAKNDRIKKSITEPSGSGHQECDQTFKTMEQTTTLIITLLAAGSIFAADTNTTDKVKDALAKLKSAANYGWTTIIKIPDMPFDPGPVKGRTEKGGYAMVTQQFNENTLEAVFKGDKVAVKSEGQWQLIDGADGPAAMMGGWLTGNGTAADEAGKLLKHVKDLKAGDGDKFTGDLTAEGAKEFLTFRPRGGNAPPPPKNTKGSAIFWLKDGALSKFESHLQGTVAFGSDQDERDFEMTRTIEIQDVGTTKLDVPAEAKKKLETK